MKTLRAIDEHIDSIVCVVIILCAILAVLLQG
jgi:hypothetical protein